MPRRNDIEKILIIGSGPIIIGQACEFDYSGTQGCKVLRQDGFKVVLINSNPATIMTDPAFGDATYIEPLTTEIVEKIIAKEKPNAILPTLGGQTALNIAADLARKGILEKYNVELIGAKADAIAKSEDRRLFKKTIEELGLDLPKSGFASSLEQAKEIVKEVGFPAIIRPSYTLGGTGGAIAYNANEFVEFAERGLSLSPIHEILIEESVIGWKEFELEVMRDLSDNVVIICSIENVDPMGVHTGDSITVAPAQTLTDKEYQKMRDWAIKIIRAIGVDTGGSNIQFAVNPKDGKMVVIEMNPRVSRSSALASKATGFPIAKIAAKLAVGYRLDEIPNDITKKTPACFEPTIDYVVVKIPRWAFEKFKGVEPILGTQMKSVGETMSIGRTFKEALQKGFRSLEIGRDGFGGDGKGFDEIENLEYNLRMPHPDRLFYLKSAFKIGLTLETLHQLTNIDPWFLEQIKEVVEYDRKLMSLRKQIKNKGLDSLSPEFMLETKKLGYCDKQLSFLLDVDENSITNYRKKHSIKATFKSVDTCAGEFKAYTPYYYSSYEKENESIRSDKKKIIILGGGPNRIGQGIEFDYCCVHGLMALKEEGFETIMVNSNPETVSTDYDMADKLYFEPLTKEDVLNIVENENPYGIIVQFGGQTPLKLAIPLMKAGVPILGTSPDSIDLAEDRRRFGALLEKMGILQPPNGSGFTFEEVKNLAKEIGYPVMVRPSYVLGGRAMEIVYDENQLEEYVAIAVKASPEHPVLVDKFLEDAIEIDVDAIGDGEQIVIGAIMEHIEEAGIHSGDSACVIPTRSIKKDLIEQIKDITYKLGKLLNVIGLMNVQYAIKDDKVYVLEVNPRASRTIPYVSKAIGVPLAKYAAKIMAGKSLKDVGFTKEISIKHYAVKEAVLPFAKFPGCDIILGPEMKSTGEVMGIDKNFGLAFAKSQMAADNTLPISGTIFISVNDKDKPKIIQIAKKLADMGFKIVATNGTSKILTEHNIPCSKVFKVYEGRPNIVDLIINGEIALVINTPLGKASKFDEKSIRSIAIERRIPVITTIAAAKAAIEGIEAIKNQEISIKPLQEYHKSTY